MKIFEEIFSASVLNNVILKPDTNHKTNNCSIYVEFNFDAKIL